MNVYVHRKGDDPWGKDLICIRLYNTLTLLTRTFIVGGLMNTRVGLWRMISLVLILLTMLGCGSFGSIQPTSTPVSLENSNGNSNSNGSGTGSGASNNNPNSNNPDLVPPPQIESTLQVTPTELADILAGPYTIRQTETLGKEKLGTPPGGVCVYHPWQVPVDTPDVSFVFVFGAYAAQRGSASSPFGYAYNIPKAGESHLAQGTYILSPSKDGSVKVSITESDHVVFKGFDGNIPGRYHFDLVPIGGSAACP